MCSSDLSGTEAADARANGKLAEESDLSRPHGFSAAEAELRD